MDRRPASLDRLGLPDRFGNRAGHRQYHLHLDTRGQAAAGAARPRAAARSLARDGHAHTVAAVVGGGDGAGRSLVQRGGPRYLGTRSDLAGRRSLPVMEERARNPCGAGRRRGKPTAAGVAKVSFGAILVQIAIIDIVFSLDSVITAVGMVDHVAIMVLAIVIAVGIM